MNNATGRLAEAAAVYHRMATVADQRGNLGAAEEHLIAALGCER